MFTAIGNTKMPPRPLQWTRKLPVTARTVARTVVGSLISRKSPSISNTIASVAADVSRLRAKRDVGTLISNKEIVARQFQMTRIGPI